MSAKQQKPTIAVLTRFVITPRARTTARVNLDTWGTDGTVQVMNIQIHRRFWLMREASFQSFIHEGVSKVGSKPTMEMTQ